MIRGARPPRPDTTFEMVAPAGQFYARHSSGTDGQFLKLAETLGERNAVCLDDGKGYYFAKQDEVAVSS
ncbi:MAG: hypothetical protein HYW51_04040 [Candidatus Doudnabacteria bacterium]|nr:hypothetical protein [Candidatus Doudnabacteria bacterium]